MRHTACHFNMNKNDQSKEHTLATRFSPILVHFMVCWPTTDRWLGSIWVRYLEFHLWTTRAIKIYIYRSKHSLVNNHFLGHILFVIVRRYENRINKTKKSHIFERPKWSSWWSNEWKLEKTTTKTNRRRPVPSRSLRNYSVTVLPRLLFSI